MSSRRLRAVVAFACLALGCVRPSARVEQPEAVFPARLTVVNNSMREGSLVFSVDGIQVLDTIVRRGGIPALVLERQIHLPAGNHRLEVFDRHLQQGHYVNFVVKPTTMTVEITLGRDVSTIRAVYAEIGYI
jgi:hypothetical protein